MKIPQYIGAQKMSWEKFSGKISYPCWIICCTWTKCFNNIQSSYGIDFDGIVMEGESMESSGGRRPTCLSIDSSYGKVIAIDIGSYSFKIGVVSVDGKVVEHETIPNKTIVSPFQL